MHIHHPKDFLTGIMFILFGAAAMTFASEYPIGTAAKMGPGYFPFALGGVLGCSGWWSWRAGLLWATGAHGWPTLRLLPVTLVLSLGRPLRPAPAAARPGRGDAGAGPDLQPRQQRVPVEGRRS